MNLLKLAQQYAQLKRTKVIGHRIIEDDAGIVFVLESGQKLTKTEDQLNAEINALKKEEQKTLIDPNDGVDNTEATAAGRALQKRASRSKTSNPKPKKEKKPDEKPSEPVL